MYSPPSFRRDDADELFQFVDRHGFATVVASSAEPTASHVPLLWERIGDGTLGRLVGHVARANPQWREADGQPTLAIFHGPHAYVSPAWQIERDVVPTWNYVAVHATGVWRTIDDRERSLAIVTALVDRYEGERPNPWPLDSISAEFRDRMLAGIVCFEIELTRVEGKWKLGQNHSDERRRRAIAGLEGEGEPEMARWMREELDRSP